MAAIRLPTDESQAGLDRGKWGSNTPPTPTTPSVCCLPDQKATQGVYSKSKVLYTSQIDPRVCCLPDQKATQGVYSKSRVLYTSQIDHYVCCLCDQKATQGVYSKSMVRGSNLLSAVNLTSRPPRVYSKSRVLYCISTVSNQNGVSLLYIMLEIHHSGREPSIFCRFNCPQLTFCVSNMGLISEMRARAI